MIWLAVAWAEPIDAETVVREAYIEAARGVTQHTGRQIDPLPGLVVTTAKEEFERQELASIDALIRSHMVALYDPTERTVQVNWDTLTAAVAQHHDLGGRTSIEGALKCVLAHELAHALVHQVAGFRLPDVLDEGYAEHVSRFLCGGTALPPTTDLSIRTGLVPMNFFDAPENTSPIILNYAWGPRLVQTWTDTGIDPLQIEQLPEDWVHDLVPEPVAVTLAAPWPTHGVQRDLCRALGELWQEGPTELGLDAMLPFESKWSHAGNVNRRTWTCGEVTVHAVTGSTDRTNRLHAADGAWARVTFLDAEGLRATDDDRAMWLTFPASVRKRLTRRARPWLEANRLADQHAIGVDDQTWHYHAGSQLVLEEQLAALLPQAKEWLLTTHGLEADLQTTVQHHAREGIGPFLPVPGGLVADSSWSPPAFTGGRTEATSCALRGALVARELMLGDLPSDPAMALVLALAIGQRIAANACRDNPAAVGLIVPPNDLVAQAMHDFVSAEASQSMPNMRAFVHGSTTKANAQAFVEAWVRRQAAVPEDMEARLAAFPPPAQPASGLLVDHLPTAATATRAMINPTTGAWLSSFDVDFTHAAEVLKAYEGAIADEVLDEVWVAPYSVDTTVWFILGEHQLMRLEAGPTEARAWRAFVTDLRAHALAHP